MHIATLKYTALLLFFSMAFESSFGQKMYREDEIVPFTLVAGQGVTSPINNSSTWNEVFCVQAAIPFEVKESIWDLQAGVNFARKKYASTGLSDYVLGFHAGIGKRLEKRFFIGGVYTGPAIMLVRYPSSRKTEIGWDINAPLVFKPLKELGVGLSAYSMFSLNESTYGLRAIISLSNIPK